MPPEVNLVKGSSGRRRLAFLEGKAGSSRGTSWPGGKLDSGSGSMTVCGSVNRRRAEVPGRWGASADPDGVPAAATEPTLWFK